MSSNQNAFEDVSVRKEVAKAAASSFGHEVDEQDVLAVLRYGSVDEGNVSPDFDDAKTDAILAELDRRGIQT
jgi:hypothetical protein